MNELNSNQNNKPVTTGDWMLTTFLAGLPIVGFILKLIWAFGKGHHPSKSNWAKAKLIWSIPIAILFIVVLLSAISIPTYFALTENSYSKEAEIQIRNIEKSAGLYYLENGQLPYDCWEDMRLMGYIDMAPRMATAKALEESVIIFVSTKEFEKKLEDSDMIIRGVMAILSERLRDIQKRR